MERKPVNILSFTPDQIPALNMTLRDLWDWVSRIQYKEVSDATSTPTGGQHGEIKLFSDGTNKVLWINIEGTWTNVGSLISAIVDHNHSSTSGEGGQLDWDNIWSDAVHSHGSNAEGGQLDWDNIWSDAVHSHQTDAEGGKIDHGGALNGLSDDDHTIYILAAGTRILTGDWDIGNGRMIQADKIRARDGDGLALYEDGGTGIFVKDGGNVGIGETDPESKIEMTGTTPYLTIHNSTESNAAGARIGKIIFKGEKADTTEHVLGTITFYHDESSDDQKGWMGIYVNDGNDDSSPTLRVVLNSSGYFNVNGRIALNLNSPEVGLDIRHTSLPYLWLTNTTGEDGDEERETKVSFRGTGTGIQYDSTLAEIEGNHDGSAGNQRGNLIFKTNASADDDSPTERLRIDSYRLITAQDTILVHGNRDLLRYSFMMA